MSRRSEDWAAMTCRVGSVDSLDLSVSAVACAILRRLNSRLRMTRMTVVVVDDFVDAELAVAAAVEVELPIVSAAVRLD